MAPGMGKPSYVCGVGAHGKCEENGCVCACHFNIGREPKIKMSEEDNFQRILDHAIAYKEHPSMVAARHYGRHSSMWLKFKRWLHARNYSMDGKTADQIAELRTKTKGVEYASVSYDEMKHFDASQIAAVFERVVKASTKKDVAKTLSYDSETAAGRFLRTGDPSELVGMQVTLHGPYVGRLSSAESNLKEETEQIMTKTYLVTTSDGKKRKVRAFAYFTEEGLTNFAKHPQHDKRSHQTYKTTGFYSIAGVVEIQEIVEPKVEVVEVQDVTEVK